MTAATASPSASRRFGDTEDRSSASCASCRSPKRARASPSPRILSSERPLSRRNSAASTSSSMRTGHALGRSGSNNKKKQLTAPPEWDNDTRLGHAATSPCRSPNQQSNQWSGVRSQRRREMSVPLLSRTLSHVSLSQSPPTEDTFSDTTPAADQTLSANTPSGMDLTAVSQTPRRLLSLRRANTPAPLVTDNLQHHPHTAPLIHSLLGSPFASTKARLYPYELTSPTWIAKGGGSRAAEEGGETRRARAVPDWGTEWREDKDVLPDLLGASGVSPSLVLGRSNSGGSDDDGSITSASSFFSSGRVPSTRPHTRPGFVTIWGDDGDAADNNGNIEPATPNRKLFAATGKLEESLLMSTTRLANSSPGTTSPLTSQRIPQSPSSNGSYEPSPTLALLPLTRIESDAAERSSNSSLAADFGRTSGFGSLSRPGYLPRMVSSARKADPSAGHAPFDNLVDDKLLSQRRISEPLQHSSGDAFATFLARCGGDRATRSDAASHGQDCNMPSSETDDLEHSPLRAIGNRPPPVPATTSAKLPSGLAPSPSTSLRSIKTRLDKLKGTPKGSGPLRSQSTRVSASARAARPNLRRGVTEPDSVPQIGTPVSQLFGDDKPSPAAFASTGLVKKRGGRFTLPRFQDMAKARSWSPLPPAHSPRPALAKSVSGAASKSKAIMDSDHTEVLSVSTQAQLEDTDDDQVSPIRPMRSGPFRRSISGHGAASGMHHRRVPSSASDITNTSPLRRTHARVSSTASSIGGLRRKGSFMFSSAASIHSDSVSEKGYSPATPTKPLPFSAIQAKFVSTPSPTVSTQQYPFARRASVTSAMSIETTSPTVSPFRATHASAARVRQLGRQPIARTSNPMLAATFRSHGAVIPTTPTADTTIAETYMSESARVAGAGRFERDFTLVQALGSGEFSCVWKVRCKVDNGLWAVKTGRPYTGARNRLRQLEEVAILRKLSSHQHPHVVQYADSWEQAGRLYIRTELADCGDLARYLLSLGDTGGLDEGRVWKVLVELTSALEFIHGDGVLHLDFKPSNILVMRDGNLKVADFGMSMFCDRDREMDRKGLSPPSSVDRDFEGDREYLAPEVLRDVAPGPEADVFSLGILVLEAALNVVLPSNGDAWVKLRNDDFSDLDEHYAIRGHPRSDFAFEAPVPSVSMALLATIRHMMAAEPAARMTVRQVRAQVQVARARCAMEDGAGAALVEEEEGWLGFLLEGEGR